MLGFRMMFLVDELLAYITFKVAAVRINKGTARWESEPGLLEEGLYYDDWPLFYGDNYDNVWARRPSLATARSQEIGRTGAKLLRE